MKNMFTQKDINKLQGNIYVSKCSSKSITYSKDFKLFAISKYYEDGYSPNMIFKEAGFDLNIIGKDKPKDCLARWRKICKTKGEQELLKEKRGKTKHEKRAKFKSKDEEIEYLKAKIAYINAENDFLAKLRGIKRK